MRRRQLEIAGNHLAGVWKALTVGVRLAVIHHDYVEAGNGRDFVQVVGDVAGAKDVEQRGWKHRLDEDFQRAAADQAGVVLGIVVEVEGERARLLLFHHFTRNLPNLGFHAAAADGAHNGAIIAHQHLRGLERRDGTANVGDGGDGAAASLAAKLNDLLVDVHGEAGSII